MTLPLSGRTAIITASTRGIGLAIARELAAEGAAIIVNGRSEETVATAIAQLAGVGPATPRGVVADVGTPASCARLIAAQPEADILVNNAAFIGWTDFFSADDAIWNEAWQTNVMAGARLARHYMRGMGDRGWGRIIFISSETARNVQPDLVPYAATKLALHALSRGIAKRMAGTGVTSNVVLPGPTLSDGARGMLEPMAAADGITVEEAGARFVRTHRPSSLLGRMATVEEVAAMVAFACSPRASATNGSVLRVDGGVVEDIN